MATPMFSEIFLHNQLVSRRHRMTSEGGRFSLSIVGKHSNERSMHDCLCDYSATLLPSLLPFTKAGFHRLPPPVFNRPWMLLQQTSRFSLIRLATSRGTLFFLAFEVIKPNPSAIIPVFITGFMRQQSTQEGMTWKERLNATRERNCARTQQG